jgi:hypothetical protein
MKQEIDACIYRAMDKIDNWNFSEVKAMLKILRKIRLEWENILTVGVGYKTDSRQYKVQTTWVFQLSDINHPNLYEKYKTFPMVEWSNGALIY